MERVVQKMPVKPRMTLDDVLADMRAHGMPMSKAVLSQCLKEGVFPFAHIIGQSPTGRTDFLILRKDYNEWAREYLHPDELPQKTVGWFSYE